MTDSTILVAMSGGVDSSVAAAMLASDWPRVEGITLRTTAGRTSCGPDPVESAQRVASHLGIRHHVVDVVDDFETRVIDDFAREYARGRTPNPCVRCNRVLKFESLFHEAMQRGTDAIATGHYARKEAAKGRYALRQALCSAKDQSYMLAALTQEQLRKSVFPLGNVPSKDHTRQLALEWNLPVDPETESQDICFLANPGDSYRDFLSDRVGPPQKGPIVSTRGEVLGEHRGLMFYTIGQRKGLGIAAPRPLFVVRIDPADNAVVVGYEEETYCTSFTTGAVSWCSIEPQPQTFDCQARIRYRQKPVPVTAVPAGDCLHVFFHAPTRAVTPGQWLVLYDGEYVLAAAMIEGYTLAPRQE